MANDEAAHPPVNAKEAFRLKPLIAEAIEGSQFCFSKIGVSDGI